MIRATELHGLTWRKSSLSNSGGGNCVEVAGLTTSHTIAIRDSKNPDGPALLLSSSQWHGLINASHGTALEL